MDMLGGDDASQLQCLGGAGHGHGRLVVGREHGSTGSKMVRNGNRKGIGKSLVLEAHRWVRLSEEELGGGKVELDSADEEH